MNVDLIPDFISLSILKKRSECQKSKRECFSTIMFCKYTDQNIFRYKFIDCL